MICGTSDSSSPETRRRVKGSRRRGFRPLRVGMPQGSFLLSQEVPSEVLGEMLGESLSQLES